MIEIHLATSRVPAVYPSEAFVGFFPILSVRRINNLGRINLPGSSTPTPKLPRTGLRAHNNFRLTRNLSRVAAGREDHSLQADFPLPKPANFLLQARFGIPSCWATTRVGQLAKWRYLRQLRRESRSFASCKPISRD